MKLWTLSIVFLVTAIFNSSPAQDASDMLAKSVIAFKGTVVKEVRPATSSMGQTVLVLIAGAPLKEGGQALRDGQKVFVTLKAGAPLAKDSKAIFFAKDVDFETLVHVYELGHQVISTNDLMLEVQENASRQAQASLISKVNSSDATFLGEVTEVHPAKPGSPSEGLASVPSDNRPPRITEHDPDWQDATVRVIDRIKADRDTYVVRFPNSPDRLWRQYPKFFKTQKATFILKRKHTSTGALMALPTGEPVYAAPENGDVLDASQVEHLKRLLR